MEHILELPTCWGIPKSMWITSSAMLEVITSKCWWLLGAFVGIKMITDAMSDIGNGKVTLGIHFNTLWKTLLIALFLTYYKHILVIFDHLIDSFCVAQEDVLDHALPQANESLAASYEKDDWGWLSWFSILTFFVQKLLDILPKGMGFLTHGGALLFMHYVKAVSLLVTMQFGPLAALFSLLPGPFRRSLATWAKSYLNISCWAITLNIFRILSQTFTAASMVKVGSVGIPFGETLGYTGLSIVLFMAILLTPTWTSKFIGGAIIANLTRGAGLAVGKAAQVAGITKKLVQ